MKSGLSPRSLAPVALAALALAVHLAFHAIDSRPAVDVGHTWTDVVGWLRGDPVRPQGAYAWTVALWTLVCGRTPWAFVLVDGLWTAALAGGIAALSARIRPSMWVLGGAVLILPLFPTIARTHWVHHPEAALAVLTLLLADLVPATVAGGLLVGVVAGFGASVRPSALAWVLPAVLPLLARERKLWWTLLPGLVLVLPGLGAIPGYLGMRWSLRGANAAAVGDVWRLWPILTGIVPGLVLLVLGALGARRAASTNVGRVGLFWAIGGVLVVAVTRAGPDNVPTAIVGLILVAAHAAVPERAVPAAAVLLLGPLTALVPVPRAVEALTGWSSRDEPLNWLVPRRDGTSAAKIADARERTCDAGPCTVVLQRGLVHPSWEDDGSLGLYLAGIDDLTAISVRRRDLPPADAAVAVNCDGDVPDPTARFDGIDDKFAALTSAGIVAAHVQGNGCVWTWIRLVPRY